MMLISLVLMMTACNGLDDNAREALQAPRDVEVRQTGLTSAKITWTVPVKDYDGVILERMLIDEEQEYTLLADLAKDVLIYQDRSLAADGTYRYRLAAYRGEEKSDFAEVLFAYSKLPAPADLQCVDTDAGLVLSWTDRCVGEEGYVVRRRTGDGQFAVWQVLGPDAETVTDAEVGTGVYEYEVCAFAGDEKSPAATVVFSNLTDPVVTVGTISSTWYMVYVPMTLDNDGGYGCRAGICWKTDGGAGATIEDNVYEYQSAVSSGDAFFGSATGLDYGRTYSIRPWVEYDGRIKYYDEVKGSLSDEPSALKADWTDISAEYSMPESIRLYRTATSVTGRAVNAWYAVADMSAGDLELRTFKTSSLTRPSVAAASAGDVQIIVNGGYFGGSQSYSYVMDRGTEAAAGVKAVTRTYYDESRNNVSRSYNITRGAFGVNRSQEPSVKWLYGSYMWAYDSPLPTYNSGPVLTPSTSYPSEKQTWDVYSAIGGGPVILKDGRLCFDYTITRDKGNGGRYAGNYELLGDDIFGPSVRPPRTAIGHTADGKIIIMVVDGRGAGGSQGVSLDELARLMKGLGCTDVLNLDGGGSSVICATPSAEILNVPSDGSERAVLSFVAIVKK